MKTYTVIALDYPDGKKIQAIKGIRSANWMGLKEAKALSESLPGVVLETTSENEAWQAASILNTHFVTCKVQTSGSDIIGKIKPLLTIDNTKKTGIMLGFGLAVALVVSFAFLMLWVVLAMIFEGIIGLDWPGITVTEDSRVFFDGGTTK